MAGGVKNRASSILYRSTMVDGDPELSSYDSGWAMARPYLLIVLGGEPFFRPYTFAYTSRPTAAMHRLVMSRVCKDNEWVMMASTSSCPNDLWFMAAVDQWDVGEHEVADLRGDGGEAFNKEVRNDPRYERLNAISGALGRQAPKVDKKTLKMFRGE